MATSTATISMLFAAMTLCSMVVISVSKPVVTELYFNTYSEHQVKGCYIHNQTLGICFDVQEGSMKLLRTTGEEIVVYQELGPNKFYYQVIDQGFIGHDQVIIYVPDTIPRVPHDLREFLTVKQPVEKTPAELEALKGHYLEAVSELHYVTEIQLLERLSAALSQNGTQLEILKPFHALCFNLLKTSDVQTPAELRAWSDLGDEASDREERCPSIKHNPFNDDCLGMCGKGCWCWRWVCGDCCWNGGCYEHDKCCEWNFWSTYCLLPFFHGFSCGSFGGYPQCR